MTARSFAIALVSLSTLSTVAASDDWPSFRGSQAGAVADDPSLPETWSPTQNVAWSIEVPGRGWSSPVVWGDKVFVTSAISSGATTEAPRGIGGRGGEGYDAAAPHRWMVYAFDFASGKMRWERELRNSAPVGPKQFKNSYASATPATDGQRLYVFFADVGLFALGFDGSVLWARETPRMPSRSGWGAGASPAVYGDRVYITHGSDTASFLAAFDKKTGNELWRTEIPVNTYYSSPYIWAHARRTEIVLAGTDKIRSFGVDGKLLWEVNGMTWISIPTPFATQGLLYVASGFPGDSVRPVYAIRPGGKGDISLKAGETSNEWIAWYQPLLGPYNPSTLVYGDYHYTLLDRGFLVCHDAKTGRQVYGRQRISADASGFTASPWAYNGKIFAISEDGDTYVMQAGPEFRLLGKNTLIDDTTLATPAIAHGSIIIRTATRLFRIAKSANK